MHIVQKRTLLAMYSHVLTKKNVVSNNREKSILSEDKIKN